MPANLRTCADCSTAYAIDLSVCPHCGSSNFEDEGGVVTKRLPLFVTTTCRECGRGPWTVRLAAVTSGLIELPTLACASCGSRVPVTWPPEEEPMSPKITVHGGATNAHGADVSPADDVSEPQAAAEGGLGLTPSEEPVEEAPAPAAVEEEDAPAADPDYDGMTLAELRDEAGKRKLATYGTKAQLIERLRESDGSNDSE